MSDFSSEDGWGFSLLSHHFRADDSDGADEGDVADAKNTLSNDNDLDLASRPDEAQFKANPWSIAKVNAASRPQQHRESIDQAPKLTSVSSAVGASKSRGQKNAAKKQTRLKQTFFTKGKSCLQDDAIISSTQTHTPSLCVSRATPASVNADDAREKRLQAIHYALNSDDSPPAVISSPYPKFATPTAAVDHLQSTPNDLNAQPHTASGPAFDVASAHTAAPSSPVILPNTYPDHDVIISLPGRDPRSPVPATVAAVSPPPPEAYPPYHREPFFDRNVFSSSQASRDIFAVQIPRHQALLVTHTDDERFILHTPGLEIRPMEQSTTRDSLRPPGESGPPMHEDHPRSFNNVHPAAIRAAATPRFSTPAVMPPILANAFAQLSNGSDRPMLASASRQGSCRQQGGSFYDPLLDDSLSSSPTVVGSSPPPPHLKEFYSLARLSPPQLPVHERIHRMAEESGPSPLPAPTPPHRPLNPPVRSRWTSEEASFLQRRPPSRPPSKMTTSDPDEEWTSVVPRARATPPRAHVKRSGAFHLPISAAGSISNGAPVTTRVQTFVPPARK